MQAGDHIQSSETAAQDSTPSTSERGAQDSPPSTSYNSTTSESTARWDAKKRAVKVPPLHTPPPHPAPTTAFSLYLHTLQKSGHDQNMCVLQKS